MASFTAGTTFVDGVANDVTAAKLAALVNNATPTSGLIQDRTAETVVATNDTFLIGDASDSNNLKRMTVANVMKAELTGTINATAGTITTLTAGTTTSTAATITTGTIPTLTSITKITSGTGTAAAPAISPTGDTNTGIFFPAADTVAFSEGGTEAMRIDSNSNVGIGATTPTAAFQGAASKLGIESPRASSDQTLLSLAHTGTITASDKINIGFDSFSATAVRRTMAQISALNEDPASGNPGSLLLYTNVGAASLTERMRITSAGNVGIGTTSATSKLHISGTGSTASNPSTSGTLGATLAIQGTTGVGQGGMLMFGATQGYHAAIKGYLTSGNNNTLGHLLFCVRNADTDTTLTEAMRIEATGNVGIGSTAPVNNLEVVGSFGRGAPVTKTTDFTLAATENWIIVNKATSCIATLPAASSWTGREFTIKTLQAVTVVSPTSNISPLNSATPGTAILSATAGAWATLVSDGTNWVKMAGS